MLEKNSNRWLPYLLAWLVFETVPVGAATETSPCMSDGSIAYVHPQLYQDHHIHTEQKLLVKDNKIKMYLSQKQHHNPNRMPMSGIWPSCTYKHHITHKCVNMWIWPHFAKKFLVETPSHKFRLSAGCHSRLIRDYLDRIYRNNYSLAYRCMNSYNPMQNNIFFLLF